MKKEIVKMLSIACAALAIGMGTASQARADERITATVPFGFIVGDTVFPAGNYVVKEIAAGSGALEIISADGKHFVTILTIPVTYDPQLHTELVFQKFGNRYFLSRVVPEDGAEREIVLTPAIMERELARTANRSAD